MADGTIINNYYYMSNRYRTPVDLRRDIDQVEHWTLDPFANDYGPDICLDKQSRRATAADAVDWYQDAPEDEFDLDGKTRSKHLSFFFVRARWS